MRSLDALWAIAVLSTVDIECAHDIKMMSTSGFEILESIPHSSLFSCVAISQMTGQCGSFVFDKHTLRCDILVRHQNASVAVQNTTMCSHSVQGSCANLHCAANERCEVDRNNHPFCVASYSCPELDNPMNGVVRYSILNGTPHAHYVCDHGFTSCGQKPAMCLKNGTWQNANQACAQFIWVDPLMIFESKLGMTRFNQSLPCSLTANSVVELIVFSKKWMYCSLEFYSQLDHFVFGVRVEVYELTLEVSISLVTTQKQHISYVCKSDEIRIIVGKQYDVALVVNDTHYDVNIYGNHCSLKHEGSFKMAHQVHVDTNVNITRMTIR